MLAYVCTDSEGNYRHIDEEFILIETSEEYRLGFTHIQVFNSICAVSCQLLNMDSDRIYVVSCSDKWFLPNREFANINNFKVIREVPRDELFAYLLTNKDLFKKYTGCSEHSIKRLLAHYNF